MLSDSSDYQSATRLDKRTETNAVADTLPLRTQMRIFAGNIASEVPLHPLSTDNYPVCNCRSLVYYLIFFPLKNLR